MAHIGSPLAVMIGPARHPCLQHSRHICAVPRRIRARVLQIAWPSKIEEGAGNAG